MISQAFVAERKSCTRNERTAAREHFLDPCDLVNEPQAGSDPTGSTYAFENDAFNAKQGEGRADFWRHGRFAWDHNSTGRDVVVAHRQLPLYSVGRENPLLLIVSGIKRSVSRVNWAVYATVRHDILLDGLLKPRQLALLKSALPAHDHSHPGAED